MVSCMLTEHMKFLGQKQEFLIIVIVIIIIITYLLLLLSNTCSQSICMCVSFPRLNSHRMA